MEKRYYCYKVTNRVNGKLYIGKTYDLENRWESHKTAATYQTPGDFSYFHNAMIKHGFDNFFLEQMSEHDTEKECFAHEKLLIKELKTRDKNIGYNLTDGGEGASGYKFTYEQRKRLSNAKKGKYLGTDNPFYGKHHTDEFKSNQAIVMKSVYDNNRDIYDAINIAQCKLNAEQCLEIQRKYLQGDISFEALRDAYGGNLSMIHKIIHGDYIAIRGKSLITEDLFQLIKSNRLKKQGLEYHKFSEQEELLIADSYRHTSNSRIVAEQFGCSQPTILKILRKHNVPLTTKKGSPRKLLTKEQELSVIDEFNNGVGIIYLALKYSVSKATIRMAIVQSGYQFPDYKLTEERKQQIISDYNDGMSILGLERKYQTTPPTISKLLKKVGIKIKKGPRFKHQTKE